MDNRRNNNIQDQRKNNIQFPSFDQWLMANNNNNTAPPSLNPNSESYHNLATMNNNVHGGYNNNLQDFDFPGLESGFNRLWISDPPPPAFPSHPPPQSPAYLRRPPPQSPAYLAPPPPHGLDIAGGNYSNPRNFSNGVDFSYAYPPYSDEEIRRFRALNAARMQELAYEQNLQSMDYFTNNVNRADNFVDYVDPLGYYLNNGYPSNDTTRRPRVSNDYPNRNTIINNQYIPNVMDLNPYVHRRRPNFTNLEDIRGKIFMVAKDQLGCRFLQTKFEKGTPEEFHMIFTEIKDNICQLMMDQFGNYLVQKMFEVCNEEQLNELLLLVINDESYLFKICNDNYGTRAVQHLLEQLILPEQRSLFTSAIRRIVVKLSKDANGHHVVEHCLKLFTAEQNKHIISAIADQCLDVAIDKDGCCVLQQCLARAQGETRQHLVAELTSNALVLSQHPYGNYVVQYILGMRIPRITSDVLAQLSRNFVSLSMNKYGSNVVERCLKESDGSQVYKIVTELLSNSSKFLAVLQDPFGNYVAQSALDNAKGEIRQLVVNNITFHYPFLHSHPHGKRVLAHMKASKLRV